MPNNTTHTIELTEDQIQQIYGSLAVLAAVADHRIQHPTQPVSFDPLPSTDEELKKVEAARDSYINTSYSIREQSGVS